MNTDKTPFQRPLHAFVILGVGLLLIGLWAWLTVAPPPGGGAIAGSVGIAGSTSGNGGGAAEAGEGQGASQGNSPTPSAAPEANPAPPETPPPETPPEVNPAPADTAPPAEPGIDEATDVGNMPIEEIQKRALVQSLTEVTPVAPDAKKTPDGKSTGRRGFYGIDVKEDGKVLFLIDVSSSMEQFSTEMLDKTRLGILKLELIKSICGGTILPTAQTFQRKGGFVITQFSVSASSYPEQGICRYRNPVEVKDALLHIEAIPTGGGTCMVPAWEEALTRVEKDKIEAVYFLTDGEPSDGFNAAKLEEMLKKRKTSKKLIIHCIAIGGDRPFMKAIADAHKGKYVCIP